MTEDQAENCLSIQLVCWYQDAAGARFQLTPQKYYTWTGSGPEMSHNVALEVAGYST